jgi:hypothetical protein
MAFGISRAELEAWKAEVASGRIAYLTHYWYDFRFPGVTTVTKVGCSDLDRLAAWCRRWDLDPAYIHRRGAYPHFDLIGPRQKAILAAEGFWSHIERFNL